jgi:phage tail-like protein
MSTALPRKPDWLVGQLPVGMLEDGFFYRFASIFQEQAATYLDAADNIVHTVDPAVAPSGMVRFLAAWLALPPLEPSLPELYQRELVKAAGKLRWWRGTKRGLAQLLSALTGSDVEVTDNGGVFRQGEANRLQPHVTVRADSTGWLSEEELVDLVRDEVPANATFELSVGGRRLWPSEAEGGEQQDDGEQQHDSK